MQDAILHNKRIFEQRMMSEGKALQRRVLHGWQVLMQHKAAKRNKLTRAQGRLLQGLLVRVFYSWKDELPRLDKTLAMTRKVNCRCNVVTNDWSAQLGKCYKLRTSTRLPQPHSC